MNQVTVTGMVLSATPVGEYDKQSGDSDKRTREGSRICAEGQGGHNSPLAGVANPFSFGEFTVYEGRTSYTMVSASISNYFAELRDRYRRSLLRFLFYGHCKLLCKRRK